MSAEKNNQVDLVENAMRQVFISAADPVDYDMAVWTAGVMADIRSESFEDTVDFKVLSRTAWFALAASLLFAAVIFISSDNSTENSGSLNDYYSGDQSILETAYRD